MGITSLDIDNWFTYHSPDEKQQMQYLAIRVAAQQFAAVLLANTSASADQTTAFRKLREAVMTANASIACKGR